MRGKKLRDARGVFAMGTHSPGQRLHSAMHQPAIERRRHRAADDLQLANALEKFVVLPRDDSASHHVAVAAEIFRSRMHDEIDSERERSLDHGAPGVIDDEARPGRVRDLGGRGEVGQL